MSEKPVAIQLANAIDPFVRKSAPDHLTSTVAASELRRLSAELEECQAQRRAAFRRIEEQDAELEKVREDAEELKFLESDLLYWVDRSVSKGNANLDIEEASARYEKWLFERNAAAMKGTP